MNNENIKYIRKKELLSSRMDNEVVMMHPESGKYFALNPVASRIWELLELPHSLTDLVTVLTAEFDIDETACTKEVLLFLESLIDKKLADKSE